MGQVSGWHLAGHPEVAVLGGPADWNPKLISFGGEIKENKTPTRFRVFFFQESYRYFGD